MPEGKQNLLPCVRRSKNERIFANCYGGVIILGVKENEDGSRYTTGLKDAAKLRGELSLYKITD